MSKNLVRVQEAKALADAGSYGAAEQILKSVVAADPFDAVAWHELGNALYRNKSFDRAADAFSRRLALEPGNKIAHYSLGVTYIELGRIEEARLYLTRASQLDPSDNRIARRLAEIAPPPLSKPPDRAARDHTAAIDRGSSSDADRESMSRQLQRGDVHPGKLILEARPLPRNYVVGYLLGIVLTFLIVGLLILLLVELERRYAHYTIFERRVDVKRGFFSRAAFSVWTFEVTEVSFHRSFLQVLTGGSTIVLNVEGNTPVHIPALSPPEQMHRLFEDLRNRALSERRDLKQVFV